MLQEPRVGQNNAPRERYRRPPAPRPKAGVAHQLARRPVGLARIGDDAAGKTDNARAPRRDFLHVDECADALADHAMVSGDPNALAGQRKDLGHCRTLCLRLATGVYSDTLTKILNVTLSRRRPFSAGCFAVIAGRSADAVCRNGSCHLAKGDRGVRPSAFRRPPHAVEGSAPPGPPLKWSAPPPLRRLPIERHGQIFDDDDAGS